MKNTDCDNKHNMILCLLARPGQDECLFDPDPVHSKVLWLSDTRPLPQSLACSVPPGGLPGVFQGGTPRLRLCAIEHMLLLSMLLAARVAVA